MGGTTLAMGGTTLAMGEATAEPPVCPGLTAVSSREAKELQDATITTRIATDAARLGI
jgi:hypothetical protein